MSQYDILPNEISQYFQSIELTSSIYGSILPEMNRMKSVAL